MHHVFGGGERLTRIDEQPPSLMLRLRGIPPRSRLPPIPQQHPVCFALSGKVGGATRTARRLGIEPSEVGFGGRPVPSTRRLGVGPRDHPGQTASS